MSESPRQALPDAPLPRRGLAIAAAALAPALIVTLVATFLISPEFYLEHVLSPAIRPGRITVREQQAVEIVTVIVGTIGFLLMLPVAWRLWRVPGGRYRPGAFAIALIAAATIFFVGEEVSWGQWIFGWKAEGMQEISGAAETNLHNIDLPIRIQSLGSVFLIIMFFVLPAAWYFRDQTRLSDRWRPAIAEPPVVFTMICAFAWKESKGIYRLIHDDYEQRALYIDFIEQIPEQKEMLIAIGLMLYGIYRIRWWGARSLLPPHATAS